MLAGAIQASGGPLPRPGRSAARGRHGLPASLGPPPCSLGITDRCTPSLFGGGGSVRADPAVLSTCANTVERGPGPEPQRVCPRVLPQIPHPSEQLPARLWASGEAYPSPALHTGRPASP